jgi:hypothetical protein
MIHIPSKELEMAAKELDNDRTARRRPFHSHISTINVKQDFSVSSERFMPEFLGQWPSHIVYRDRHAKPNAMIQ